MKMKKKTKHAVKKLACLLLVFVTVFSLCVPAMAATTATNTYFKPYTGRSSSLVDALKSLGEQSSYSYRKSVAALNGLSSYTGKSWENEQLLAKLRAGTLIKSVSTVAPSAVTMYVKTSGPSSRLNLRSAPNTSSSVLAKLTYGTALTLLSSSNGWAKVSVPSVGEGYVSMSYLSETNPLSTDSATTITARQQAMVDAAMSMLGSTKYNGYCQRYVRIVGEKMGLPSGNAASALAACQMWRVSTSMDNIPVGAVVYLRSKNTSSAGYTYGHVGVYAGGCQVIHAQSKVKVQSLTSLLSSYTYLGWGWQAGVPLA